MKNAEYYIKLLQQHSDVLRTKYGITMMCLFGSVARGEQHEGSDVDLFVEMPPRLYNAVAASDYLEQLLGCKVDLVRNHQHIRSSFLEQVKQDGVQIYTTA